MAWWLSREPAQVTHAKQRRAEQAAAAMARDARPVVYRWHDANGVLQITDKPPHGKDAGRRFERIDKAAPTGIEVHGDRQ